MAAPLVSIIMPAYNAQATIGGAIASVQQQSLNEWELIVVDDGSTDDTAGIAVAAAAQDARIKIIKQNNAGVAAARRAALAKAEGRYIAFLDADDEWLPEKLSRQVAFMRRTNAPVSYTAYRRFNSERVGDVVQVPARLTYNALLINSAIANLTGMIDRTMVPDIKIPDMHYEDFAMWLSALRPARTAHGLNEDLARYRVSVGSLSSNKGKGIAAVWRIYREQEKIPALLAAVYLGLWGLNAVLKRLRF